MNHNDNSSKFNFETMNKILYSPKEGTTGFWGLRDVPEEPTGSNYHAFGYASFEWKTFGYEVEIEKYNEALESCKSNKLEIVNPEVIPNVPLWPGDIFDLPIGYEFEKGGYCEGCRRAGMYNCAHFDTCGNAKEVLRLVKTETKEEWEIIAEKASSIPIKYLEIELVNRFQNDDMHRAIRFIKEVMAIKFDKKQCDSINPNCGFIYDAFEILKGFKSALREEIEKLDDWATMHLDDGEMIGFKRACSEIEEKLDSLTPKK